MINKGTSNHKYTKARVANYLYIPKKEIFDQSALEKKLTVHSKYDVQKRIELFCHCGEWFGVPLYYWQNYAKIANNLIDERIIGEAIDFKFVSDFWRGQKDIVDAFRLRYEEGKTGFIIEAKTGSGKSCIAMAILAMIGKRSLVIVPRSNLVNQWIDKILEHTDLKCDDIGIINGLKVNWQNKKIVVGLVHSLALDKFGNDFKNNFGVVVFDEVHSSVPPATFAPVATMFNPKIRIAMSATLTRVDGLDVIFRKHIGETYLTGNITKRFPAIVLIHNYNRSSGRVPIKFGEYTLPKLSKRGILLSKLAKNYERNRIIVRYILSMLKSNDRRVLVLSDRTWQLVLLKKLLDKNASHYKINLKNSDSGYFVNTLSMLGSNGEVLKKKKKITQEERQKVADNCKVIFATYAMFGLGSNIPELSGLIYATPQSSVEQAQGRIERFLDDKRQPVVVDIVDTYYKETLRWAKARQTWYKKVGIKVRKI